MSSSAQSEDALDRLTEALNSVASLSATLGNATQAARRDAEAFDDLALGLAECASQVGVGAQEALRTVAEANVQIDVMDRALVEAQEGYGAVAESLARAHQDGERLGTLVERVSEVPRAAQRIIDLSNSANMLALNATIEAERAGSAQAGGFRVVAREMKDLARQIRAFAEDIDRLTREVARDLGEGARALSESLGRCDADRNASAGAFERLPEARESLRAVLAEAQQGVEASDAGAGVLRVKVDETRDLASRQSDNARLLGYARDALQGSAEGALAVAGEVVATFRGISIVDLPPEEALARLGSMQHLIDVRTREEYSGDLGHIDGTRLVPISDQFGSEIAHLSRDAHILFICRSGGRSNRAATMASEMGFRHVYNLAGGMLKWTEKQLPAVDVAAPLPTGTET